jgi:hydrogenase nickel incorporation protein HypA/HybF
MHELSLALSIIEIAQESAHKENAKAVNEIELEIGTLSGVVLEAMEFALDAAVKGTILENAKTKIITIPGRAKCLACSHEFDLDDIIAICPKCDSFETEIIQGKELRIKSLIINT